MKSNRIHGNSAEAIEPESQRLAFRLGEVSKLIGIPVSTLRKMIRRGEINPVTAFGTWLVTREELDRLLSRRLR